MIVIVIAIVSKTNITKEEMIHSSFERNPSLHCFRRHHLRRRLVIIYNGSWAVHNVYNLAK